jgi:hypothetical protein
LKLILFSPAKWACQGFNEQNSERGIETSW